MRDPALDHPILASRRLPVLAIVAAMVAGIALLAASVLWLHYGTSVFFEMVAAGIAACF